MYKIGQFSKITGLTIKALRYYDEEQLLCPSFRNGANQYRYYDDEDIKKAKLIMYLRSLDFSIMELREALDAIHQKGDLAIIFQEKISHIEDQIIKERKLIQKMKERVSSLAIELPNNEYHIDSLVVDEMLVASIRFQGAYTQLDHYVPQLYASAKQQKNGRHFNCYYDDGCVEEADIELCLPIKKTLNDPHVVCKTIPKITAIRTTHYGPYETLYLAYKALFTYCNTHDIKLTKPTREVYIKSPGIIFKGNTASYVTEILLPYES